ncbi:MAG: hypothetical protein KZY61_05570 [Clostridiaceae bacterium]|nr:hypothetical protein [Clostridiaceae bacterium]MBW4858659.1 hypothetical protein [Clostridiaceae bacterium]MBW4868118.1 hypothetical protein [Clostridiaceae bacterium]
MEKKIGLLSLLFVFLLPTLVLAEEVKDKFLMYEYIVPEEEVRAEEERQIKEIEEHLKSLNGIENDDYVVLPRNNPNDYVHKYGPTRIATIRGFAGNQPVKGRKFSSGGGFYYSSKGGPTASASISFPSPFNVISISANLGQSGSSGVYVAVPNRTDYFKLYIEKDFQVKPCIIYKKQPNGKLKEWTRLNLKTLYRERYYSKKIKQ